MEYCNSFLFKHIFCLYNAGEMQKKSLPAYSNLCRMYNTYKRYYQLQRKKNTKKRLTTK